MSVSLEEIDQELSAKPAPIQKVRYSHAAMAELILTNPAISQNDIALHFGYSASWVSTILCSDAFQSYLAERREQLVDPLLKSSIEENMKGLVLRSLEVLKEKMDRPTHQISDQFALRTLEATAKAAGFGARPEAVVQPVQQGDHLVVLAARLVQLRGEVIDGKATKVLEAQDAEGPAQSAEG